ncbi:MAG: arginine N-succinyltransferase [Pseudomonadota bacterium]
MTASSVPLIRPVRPEDFNAVFELARRAGGGMTNLPADEPALRTRVDFACESFAANAVEPGPEVYMTVLEVGGRILGTSAVFSSIGLDNGFVNYKVNWTFHASRQVNKRIKRRLLVLTHDFTGAAEVGSLFLSPDARGGGYGKFLARTRYLFIAQRPDIIADPVCAELRGWRAPGGAQPFWEALGRRFFEMEFEEADVHNAANGNQFIAELMPRYPIYVSLLPEDARACIGRPHDGAAPAYNMLMAEGFRFNDYIDIFDGGPLVDAKQNEIRTIRESMTAPVAGVIDDVDAAAGRKADAIVATGAVADFRAVRTSVVFGGDAGPDAGDRGPAEGVVIGRDAADRLGVEPGAPVRWVLW